jgi:hypothetical protein
MDAAKASLSALFTFVVKNPADLAFGELQLMQYPSYFAWHDATDPGDDLGVLLAIGSRFKLLPTAACVNAFRRGLAAEVLINLSSATTVDVHLVVGGAVSKLDLDYTSVTPAFRAASAHIFAGAS